MKKEKGITLVALVITIIVLLILAGVSIATLSGENGILTKAGEAKIVNAEKSAKEAVELILNEWQIEKYTGSQTLEQFLNSKVPDNLDGVSGIGPFDVEKDGYIVTVSQEGELTGIAKSGLYPQVSDIKVVSNSDGSGTTLEASSQEEGTTVYINFTHSIEGGTTTVSPSLPFAVTKNGKVEFIITGTVGSDTFTKKINVKVNQFQVFKVGDFVNYTAGVWTESEITKLTDAGLYSGSILENTNNSRNKFGGFKVGDSKDLSITPTIYDTSYINKYSSGWRVLSINGNMINIIHAGTPEAYCFFWNENEGYKSEYILSGKKNTSDKSTITEGVSVRNWNMYVNSKYAISAHCMTFNEAYMLTNSYNQTLNDLRSTGSYYNLANAGQDRMLYHVQASGSIDCGSGTIFNCCGIRPVVTLKTGIQVIGGSGTYEEPYQLDI